MNAVLFGAVGPGHFDRGVSVHNRIFAFAIGFVGSLCISRGPAIANWSIMAKIAIMTKIANPSAMPAMSAKDAKNGFGRLIDLARARPVAVEKHGRTVVVVLAVEEYDELCKRADSNSARSATADGRNQTPATKKSKAKRRV